MKKSPVYNKYCYYCICTACNSLRCPHRHKDFKQCTACQDRGFKPRLFCDYFSHFAKKYQYRVKRVSREQLQQNLKLILRLSDHHIIICKAENIEKYRQKYPWAKVELMRIDIPETNNDRK